MNSKILLIINLLGFCMISCSKNQVGVSKEYYYDHKDAIQSLISTYDTLQKKQNFALGFMDNQDKYYTLQIITDTVRYTYNSNIDNEFVTDKIEQMSISKKDIETVASKINKAEAIWIDTEDFFIKNKKFRGIRLSFKAITLNKPFTPQEFYVLIYFSEPINEVLSKEELEKYGLTEIAPKYYHTLSNSFR